MYDSFPAFSCMSPTLGALILCYALHWLHSNFTWTGLVHKYCSTSAMMKVRLQKQWRKLWKCTAVSTSILGILLLNIFVEQYIRNTKMRQLVASFFKPCLNLFLGIFAGCMQWLFRKEEGCCIPAPLQMCTLALYFNNLAKTTFWLKLFKF